MRFLLDPRSYDEMRSRSDHTVDCYVRKGEYLHHMYVDGIKYVVARALYDCIKEATERKDAEAIRHLSMHKDQLDMLVAEAQTNGTLQGRNVLGGEVQSSVHTFFNWIRVGEFNIDFSFLVDRLSVMMLLIITGIGCRRQIDG